EQMLEHYEHGDEEKCFKNEHEGVGVLRCWATTDWRA
ncbi:hypothetical protein A2U01_0105233, partial [Trifolium medium]|nr:hypothetical protein [Trifolium medium]